MARRATQEPVPPQTGAHAQASSPLGLDPPDWKQGLRRAVKEFKDDHGTLTAAGMAFYWFLAVFPALLAAIALLGVVNAGDEAARSITKGIQSALPGEAATVLTAALDRAAAQSTGDALVATVVGLAVALWSASAGMVAVQKGLDIAYDVGEERKFVKQRLVALVLLVATAVFGGVATGLIVFGEPLGDALRDTLPFGDAAFGVVWTALRWALGILALSLLFATFYYVAPNRESPRWTWVSPGGAVATLIWLLASLGFSVYVARFGSYAETYGSLAGVVVLLLWLFLSAVAVVFGAEINAELERQSAIQAGQVPSPTATAEPPPRQAPAASAGAATTSSAEGGVQEAWAQRMRELRAEDDARRGGGARSRH